VFKKLKSKFGNVPIKLVATVLVAIFIPSVIVTALGLVTVFQADRFVKDFVSESFREQLRHTGKRLSERWAVRLDSLERRLLDAHQRGRHLARLRVDPDVADVLYSDVRGLHLLRGLPPHRELWANVDSAELRQARRWEGEAEEGEPAQGSERATLLRKAHEVYLRLLESEDESVVVVAVLGAARTSYRLGRQGESLEHLDHALRRFGETVDETGVLRKAPILLRQVEILREVGGPQVENVATSLMRTLRDESPWLPSRVASMYRKRLEAIVPYAGNLALGPQRGSGRYTIDSAVLAAAREPLTAAVRSLEAPRAPIITHVPVADGGGATFLSARAGDDGFVVHVMLEPRSFLRDIEMVLADLQIDTERVGVGRSGHELEFGSSSGSEPIATVPLPRPFESYEMRYLLASGEVPVGFRSFEVLTLATFTWAVIVLVLTIIVGVYYTLRYVFVETKTARLKSDFVSFISHELKTPLAAIRMFTETLLANRVADEEERTQCLRLIDRESDRLQGLIDKVLAYSKVEREQKVFQFRSCSMDDVVRDSVRLFHEHTKDRPRKVEVSSVQRVSYIQMDRAAMVELVLNLLSNAAKYSPRTTKISLTIRETVDDIILEVIDRGVGIPRRDQKRVFEKFFRSNDYLSREIEGTGLGLAFSRYIAKVHNGELRVASQVNVGSVFTLQLKKTHVIAAE